MLITVQLASDYLSSGTRAFYSETCRRSFRSSGGPVPMQQVHVDASEPYCERRRAKACALGSDCEKKYMHEENDQM